jgi:hypothetical protein
MLAYWLTLFGRQQPLILAGRNCVLVTRSSFRLRELELQPMTAAGPYAWNNLAALLDLRLTLQV